MQEHAYLNVFNENDIFMLQKVITGTGNENYLSLPRCYSVYWKDPW